MSMISRIVVGRGNARTVVELPRDRDTRRSLANKIKGAFWPDSKSYQAAKQRGLIAMGTVRPAGA